MSALQVEWITFSKAREIIIAEVLRQLDLEDEHQQLKHNTTPPTADHKRALCFINLFIPRYYRQDFLSNMDNMKVVILPSLFCIICLVVASGISSFDSVSFYPAIITVTVLLVVASLNVVMTLRYKNAERYELRDQVYVILEHYVASIEGSRTKDRVGSFLNTSHPLQGQEASPGEGWDEISARTELNAGHSHACVVSVYRENVWQRLPVLLLVKGDIISLMVREI